MLHQAVNSINRWFVFLTNWLNNLADRSLDLFFPDRMKVSDTALFVHENTCVTKINLFISHAYIFPKL